jgi:GNAT superfamily N-acetyltransferase
MALLITSLNQKHDLKHFDCGKADLNLYLSTTAGQHQRKFISKTYVLVDDELPSKVLGFYTLAVRRMVATRELPANMGKRLPKEVPAFSLARLAIAASLHGQHLGENLLIHAMQRAVRVANEIGGYALFVDAKDEEAARFHKKYGFQAFPDNPTILCMPFSAMQELV